MPQEYWIVDVEALNRVYQAARNFVTRPGLSALLTLIKEIVYAEHPYLVRKTTPALHFYHKLIRARW